MVDTTDLKSVAEICVWVRVPPEAVGFVAVATTTLSTAPSDESQQWQN